MPTAKVSHRRTDFLEPMVERFFFGVAMDEENVARIQLDRSPRALCEPTRLRPDEAQVSPGLLLNPYTGAANGPMDHVDEHPVRSPVGQQRVA